MASTRFIHASALVLVICSACGTTHPAGDAGPDASTDAGPEIVRDGARDAARVDSGEEPDLDTQVGWVPLEGFPPECMMARAEHPEVLFRASFRPCGDAMPGCVEIPPDSRFSIRHFHSKAGHWHDGERGYFVVTESRSESETINVIADTEGGAYAAWRDAQVPGIACVGWTAVGDGYGAHGAIALRSPDGMASRTEGPQRFYHAPLSEVGRLDEPTFIADDVFRRGNSIGWIETSATSFLVRTDYSREVVIVEGDRWVTMAGSPRLGFADNTRLVGREGLWTAMGPGPTEARLVVGGIDHEETVLHAEPGAALFDVETDGVDIVWRRTIRDSRTGEITTRELWTAPYTTDPAMFRPRRVVADLPPMATEVGTVGAGYYAFADQDQEVTYISTVYVIDLRDGSRWRYDLPLVPAHWYAHGAAWVTSDEVAVATSTSDGMGGRRQTLIRIQLSAMTRM
jgi:hypothetical protein